jgi:small subunit ribosomal protein S21
MLIVNVKEHGNIERALKALKSKVIKTRQVKQLQERKEFVKDSVKKRNKVLKAIYKEKLNKQD